MTTRRWVLASLVLTTLAGCGDPYAEHSKPTPPQGEQPAAPLSERPDRVPARALARTPEDAARRVAELTTNWTGETAGRRYAELVRVTVGAARRSAREAAVRLPADTQLSAAGSSSSGTVEAVVRRRSATERRRGMVIVTHETLTADGLRQRRWRVTLATAVRLRGGWVLSRWEPQP